MPANALCGRGFGFERAANCGRLRLIRRVVERRGHIAQRHVLPQLHPRFAATVVRQYGERLRLLHRIDA